MNAMMKASTAGRARLMADGTTQPLRLRLTGFIGNSADLLLHLEQSRANHAAGGNGICTTVFPHAGIGHQSTACCCRF